MHDGVVGVEDPAVVVSAFGDGSVYTNDGRFNDGRVPVSLSGEVTGSCKIVCVDNVGACWGADDGIALLGMIVGCCMRGKA